MRSISPKIKINYLTYFLFLTYVLTGHFKNIIIIFSIVLFHEIGHVFFLIFYKYPIQEIELLPFGGITKTSKLLNTPIKHDLIIYLGGVLFQIILYIFFLILLKNNFISEATYNLFLDYNIPILIFNILPIRPLDGGEILKLLLEKKYSFIKAQKKANQLSLLFLMLFFLINLKFNLNNYMIISFLLFKIYELIKKENIYRNKFMLERLIYTLPYQKIKNENIQNINLLKKDTFHFFKDDKKYLSEKKLLKRKFDINSYF